MTSSLPGALFCLLLELLRKILYGGSEAEIIVFSWTNVVCLFNLVFTDIVITAKIEMDLSSLILYAFTLFY